MKNYNKNTILGYFGLEDTLNKEDIENIELVESEIINNLFNYIAYHHVIEEASEQRIIVDYLRDNTQREIMEKLDIDFSDYKIEKDYIDYIDNLKKLSLNLYKSLKSYKFYPLSNNDYKAIVKNYKIERPYEARIPYMKEILVMYNDKMNHDFTKSKELDLYINNSNLYCTMLEVLSLIYS